MREILFPWRRKSAKILIPPPPSVLLANSRETYIIHRPDPSADNSFATLYRIYWAIVMDDTIKMRDEIEYFWTRKGSCWKVCNIPRPPDTDPQRLAIVSAIPNILAAAFNRLINLGLPREAAGGILTSEDYAKLERVEKTPEKVPQWVEEVPPLKDALYLPTHNLGAPPHLDREGADPFMAQKNVLVWRLHIYFT